MMFMPFLAWAGEINLTVLGKELNGKMIYVAAYDNAADFPAGRTSVTRRAVRASSDRIELTLSGVTPGYYALSVFADMNTNGKLDRNFLGIPGEPTGASNDARGRFGPPAFLDAVFHVGDNVIMKPFIWSSRIMDIQPVLQLRHIRRRFMLGETTIDALNDVSLDIRAGEFLAVWGPSGSGKSTLMNIIGLIDAPTGGEVHFEAQDTGSLDDNALTEFRSKKLGFVFQNFNLVPVLTARENVMMPLQIQGVPEKEARERAAAALVDVGLERFMGSRPDKLSGGQRQRVAIARALVINPKLVIADEPTANLDSENSRMVVELMRKMNRSHNVTFVFTTHDPRLLEHVDRKILLRDGNIESDEVMQ